MRNQVSTESEKSQIYTRRRVETVFQDQTFIGMEDRCVRMQPEWFKPTTMLY